MGVTCSRPPRGRRWEIGTHSHGLYWAAASHPALISPAPVWVSCIFSNLHFPCPKELEPPFSKVGSWENSTWCIWLQGKGPTAL